MSDPGGDDPDAADPALRSLRLIARTLGTTVEAFYRPADDGQRGSREAEEGELIALFRMLDDPQERRRCLDWVRTLVDGTDAG